MKIWLFIQKISSENNSEHKVGQDTTSAISTPNKQNNIIFFVIDKDEYQWMKEHIDEINITLNMLDEKPIQIQFNEKKEIEELSTSYNDTQTRSQSLNSKIILYF